MIPKRELVNESERLYKNSYFCSSYFADIAQLVEHIHGKDEVAGSIPALGSRIRDLGFEEARR